MALDKILIALCFAYQLVAFTSWMVAIYRSSWIAFWIGVVLFWTSFLILAVMQQTIDRLQQIEENSHQ